MIDPYQNDHQSMQIGQLIVENQTDKVIVYGDIDIYKTEEGLAQARQLQQLFNRIVETLTGEASAGDITTPDTLEQVASTQDTKGVNDDVTDSVNNSEAQDAPSTEPPKPIKKVVKNPFS